MGGRISPAIPRLLLAKASRRLPGLTRKPEPGGTLCEGAWCLCEPYDPVGNLMPKLNDWCIFPLLSFTKAVQRRMRVLCMLSKDPVMVQLSMSWSTC